MKLCFVTPRCGEHIVGGAETLVLQLAKHLQEDRGHTVQILTSCAEDNRTWDNVLPSGPDQVAGLPVLRFSLAARNLDTWVPLQIAIAHGQSVSLEDELEWMAQSVTSAPLLQWLAMHGEEFDAIFFAPYLFGFTFWGSLTVPKNAWLIPCLHDESYAYTKVVDAMFRIVGRALFNSTPEQDLARALYGQIRGGEVGMGFVPPPQTAVPSPVHGRYAVVLGRKETGKNAQVAIDYFVESKAKGLIPDDLKLVIAGGGDFKDLYRDAVLERGDVVDLTRLSEDQKLALLRSAVALIQPSVNESFSIVLMEAWLQGTPALVHGQGAVTRDHVLRSKGGLYFLNADEFGGALGLLCKEPSLRNALGQNGDRYVRARYNWSSVLERFEAVVGATALRSTPDGASSTRL